ncbi:MAG: cytochrome b N-terminal domain-containing protein [Streptosporangiaceae bacterium]
MAKFGTSVIKKVFPDHWSFLLGEIALYAFVILLATGTFLTLFFKPGMNPVVYDGSYEALRGVKMSEAYASTLNITFDVRGGLLMRQMHHWAAVIFIAAIMIHALRHFFTGSYRKPRELNWLIGMGLFVLALLEGFAGYSLPDDLLSGSGLRIAAGVMESIPLVGSYLTMFVFGGEFPDGMSGDFIPRLYIVHVLLVPGVLLLLIPLHGVILTWVVKHTQFPGPGRTERNVVGYQFFPVFMAKTMAFFLATATVTALLATFLQINPVWLFGPYDPSAVSAGAQPDWYLGFLEGALRVMPGWELSFLGYTLSLNVFIPAVVVPGLFFTALGAYPFLERWYLKDDRYHHTLDRPRNAPFRTSLGAAGVTFYGLLWAAGGNDVIASQFNVSLYATTWFFRVTLLAGPFVAYAITHRICMGLQRRDAALVEHGVETGIIVQSEDGEFEEVTRPLTEAERSVVLSKKEMPRLSLEPDESGVVSPNALKLSSRLRVRLNEAYHREPSNGNGAHGNGNGAHGNGNGAHGNGALGNGNGRHALETAHAPEPDDETVR